MASNGSGFLIQPVQAITPPRPPHQRQRARKACIPCRQRKRKCDVLMPCTMCTTYGYDCRYSEGSTTQSGRQTVIQISSPHISSESNIATNDAVDSGISQHINKKARLRLDDDVQSRAPQPVIDQGILDPFKSRYMSQNSAVAFPRSLGLDLQSANPPPLHSFAWNCGIRPEEGPSTHVSLSELVSHAEFASYADVYFSTVHPIFGVLDRQHFMQRCDNYYLNNSSQDLELGALMGSVVALGSFFSFRSGHPREMDIVKHVKGVLEDATISRRPTLDQINAWIMRTLYLRSTTRPHVAWLASTMTLHLAEAVGLHHEVHSVLLTTENTIQSVEPDQAGAEQARRTFWTAWSTNTIMAYEYGRSQRTFSSISCKPIKPVVGDFTAQHILLAQLIPGDNATEPEQKEDLQHALKQLQQVPNDSSFMSLAKADVCFCFYRRLRLLKQGLEKETVRSIIDHGNKAVAAASELAQKGCPWWNILSTVFQYFCVLLAIDTSESLSTVSSVLENLENIVQILDTHLAREALETAKVLLRDSMAKKRHDLALLEVANGTSMPGSDKDVDINWDALLDPSYSEVLMSQDFPQF